MADNAQQKAPKEKTLVSPQAKKGLSRPVFTQTITLNTLQAQRVMERRHKQVARALFNMDVIMRIIAKKDEVEQVEAIIAQNIEDVSKDVEAYKASLLKKMEEHGIEGLPAYSDPVSYSYAKDSQRIASFTAIILKLDELVPYIDGLWLNTVISTNERSDTTFQWQQRVLKLANRIINFEQRARIAAYRDGHQEEVDAQALPATEGEDEPTAEELEASEA